MTRLIPILAITFSATARADSGETPVTATGNQPAPRVHSLGIGSSFAGRPAIVSQQWTSERTALQYLFGGGYDRFAVTPAGGVETTTGAIRADVGTYFVFNVGRWRATEGNVLAGFEASINSVSTDGLDRVTDGSVYVVLGLQVQRRITRNIGAWAQAGILGGIQGRAEQIAAGTVAPDAEAALRTRVLVGPDSFTGSLGLLWWLW